MARSENKDLPHHVKERLRHQKTQKMLENVASHVPKPARTKRETKATKLRRVVLYLKYLIHKNKELNQTKLVSIKRNTKCPEISTKINGTSFKFQSKHKVRRKGANIVFLKKLSDASGNKQKAPETLIHQKCCSDTDNGLELQTAKTTVSVIDCSRSKNIISSDNGLELYHEKSAANLTDRYVPNGELENISYYDIGLWKEDYPAISKSFAERKRTQSGSNFFHDEISYDYINGKENNNKKLIRNGTGLGQYVQEFSKDLEKIHKNNSDKSLFESGKLEKSCVGFYNCNKETKLTNRYKKLSSDAEYSFHKLEKPSLSDDTVALKNYHSSSNVNVDKHQNTEQQTFSQSSGELSFEELGTFTTLNNFEVSNSFNNSEVPKNDEQCFDDIKMYESQHSKYKIFSQGSDDLSQDFFSSGDSSTKTSLYHFEKPHVSSYSSRPTNDPLNYCNDKVDKYQLSKYPSDSQSSDNFSSDIFSSGESGLLISSNENERIEVSDIVHRSCNASPDILLKPESGIDEDSFDYSLTPPQRNCDIITSPDIFCDTKHDIRKASSDFSVDNILSKSCVKNSPLFSPNSERYLDYNIHEPSYNVPFIHNSAYGNVLDNRFTNYFIMNNGSQNLPLHALPPFAQIGNYPFMNMGGVARYPNIVPNDEIYAIGTCYPHNPHNFNYSMYGNEDMGNYLGVPIKQEDQESFLPPEELSCSLNNFENSGYCFSQRNFNIQ